MADNNDVLLQEQPPQPTNDLPAEVRQMMDASFGIAPAATGPAPLSADPPPATDAQPQNGEPTATTPPQFFADYGFSSKEEFDAKWNAYRESEGKPAPIAEPKFENEYSGKVYKALQAGELQQVHALLDQQFKLEGLLNGEVTEGNAESIVKMGMAIKYPSLTADEIDYKFQKQYGIPKEPMQMATETDEEFADRKGEWQTKVSDLKRERLIEAKLLRPELEASKSKLVLNIAEDETEQQRQQASLDRQNADRETKEAYQKLTPSQLKAQARFADEASKIEVNYEFEPDQESFRQVIEAVSNSDQFRSLFQGQDGNLDRVKFAKTIYYGLNFEKALLEGMRQAKTATVKSQLPDNTQGGLTRQLPQMAAEPDYLQKHMNAALHGF